MAIHAQDSLVPPARRSAAWTAGAVAAVALLAGALVGCAGKEARSVEVGGASGPTFATEPAAGGDAAGPLSDSKQLLSPSGEASGARAPLGKEAAAGAKNAAPAPAPASPGAAPAASQGGPESEPAMPTLDFLGRSIIRTGSMELQVDSVADAFERVSSIATGAGGFISESRFFGRQADPTRPPRTGVPERGEPQGVLVRPPQGGASLTLRIPANRFDDVVQQLRGVATEVRSISTGSQDVTGDVTDLESTIRNLRAVEARYVEMLGSARTTADILQIQDRLNQTRAQIERADGRLSGLRRLADMSTLTVSLSPAVPEAKTAKPSAFAPVGEAWDASLDALRSLGLAILIAGAFGWWMLPLLALALWGAARLVRNVGGRGRAPLASIDTPQSTA